MTPIKHTGENMFEAKTDQLINLALSIVFAVLAGTATAHASQADLQEAYTAYQEAAATGDVRAALPHAERAYELGLALFGPDSRSTGLLAFNYGAALNELHKFEDAFPVIATGLSALESSTTTDPRPLYDINIEMARAHLGIWRGFDSQPFLQRALDIAQGNFGESSVEVARVYYLIATIPFRHRNVDQFGDVGNIPRETGVTITLRRDTVAEHRDLARRAAPDRGRVRDWLNELRVLRADYIQPAEAIFANAPDAEIDRATLRLLAAMYNIELDERNSHRAFAEALEAINDLHYADMITFRLVVDWLSHPDRHTWSQRRAERFWQAAIEHGFYRREGSHIYMLRVPPQYPNAALRARENGLVCLRFDISVEGRTDNVEVYESEGPSVFHQPSIDAIESFILAPRIENGVPTAAEGVRFCFSYQYREP